MLKHSLPLLTSELVQLHVPSCGRCIADKGDVSVLCILALLFNANALQDAMYAMHVAKSENLNRMELIAE